MPIRHRHDTKRFEKAILVQVICGRRDRDEAEESLHELERLADTAGAVVVGRITQRRERPTPAHFIGEGKLGDVKLACSENGANLVIFDNELSSAQVNNIDLALGIKVIDRTELILQIFAHRARSAEAQIQVELAQLEYLITRIPVSEKQARFTGGIGMRGPGESPFQLRNAPMRKRIKDLKEKLELIQKRRQRSMTKKPAPIVCLVGYTNAGKSTLLNSLSKADAYVDDRLFATLDTKTRLVYIGPGLNVLLTDTVGFIRNLPHGLIASFRSTLSVAVESDLLLVVIDASHHRIHDHIEIVRNTLKDIGADGVSSLLLFNKCDTPEAQAVLPKLREQFPDSIELSAKEKNGLDILKEAISRKLSLPK